jgi:mono/diheme cytochrome c family protein
VIAAALVALSLASACDGGASAGPDGRGAELFRSNCAMCHGLEGKGMSLAPTLEGKARHWSRADLLAYLVDPQGFAAKVPRLAEQGKRYSLPMPSYKQLPREDLEALAEHALSLD